MMNKKNLKWYETPAVEAVDMEAEEQLLAASIPMDDDDWASRMDSDDEE